MSTELVLTRNTFRPLCTIGELVSPVGHLSVTMEPTVREVPGEAVESWKVQDLTAIPQGRYQILMQWSPKFGKNTPHLQDVPDFSEIEIHIGNFPRDTDGCILVATSYNPATPDFVSESGTAVSAVYSAITAALAIGQVWITVTGLPPAVQSS